MSKKKQLVIYGVGKFAEYVYYVFQNDSSFEVSAFCIESNFMNTNKIEIYEKPVVTFDDLEDSYPSSSFYLFIAVGDNLTRKRIFDIAKGKGYQLASYVSSKATYWENLIHGENVFIDEGTMLQPFVTIKNNCILFACNIGHHTEIGAHSLISVSTTGGNVRVGENCFIGMNSVIKQNTHVEKNNIIGMGCIIDRDTDEGSVYSNKGTAKRTVGYEKIAKSFLK